MFSMYPKDGRRTPPSPAARRLALLERDRHLRDPATHGAYVATVFDAVEPTYDRFTRVFSFGMDARWKRELLDLARDMTPRDAVCVDLATGTGDLAVGAAAIAPRGRVIGLDFSRGMLGAARRRIGLASPIRLAAGDMMRLPLAAESVDLMTAAYGFRNVADPAAAVAEVHRVLRPGGVLVTLDFYKPPSRIWRGLFLRYLGAAGALVGWAWHGVAATYGYIAPSLDGWHTAAGFAQLLEGQGLRVSRQRTHLGGGIGVHVATKPRAP
jgi:demethylmenaquinone methyltransferase/2-methoxy-6-polyprenyl-1,4-benzoquinol methylase